MGAEAIILFNPYTYNFLKGLTHSAMVQSFGESLSCWGWMFTAIVASPNYI